MALSSAWAVDGGKVPAAMARMVAWCATSGASGIVLPTDLKVTALPTPGGAVNIRLGGAVVASTFATAGKGESYACTNDATEQLEIPATSSGGARTDYVILRVDDPEFDGSQPPEDLLGAAYCSFQRVSSITGLNYPFVPLAKVTVPASTAAITASMITDLREVANPRTEFHQIANALVTSEAETLAQTRDDGEFFPNAGGMQKFDIPSWATRVSIRCEWSALLLDDKASTGRLWVGWGDKATDTRYENNTQEFAYAAEASGYRHRVPSVVADYMVVPAKYRGRKGVSFAGFGRKVTGVGATMDGLTGMVWQVLFLEVPDSSDS